MNAWLLGGEGAGAGAGAGDGEAAFLRGTGGGEAFFFGGAGAGAGAGAGVVSESSCRQSAPVAVRSLTQPSAKRTRITPCSLSRRSSALTAVPAARTPALSESIAKPARICAFLTQVYCATGSSTGSIVASPSAVTLLTQPSPQRTRTHALPPTCRSSSTMSSVPRCSTPTFSESSSNSARMTTERSAR
eukprot:COSAG04_NODE_1903_length_5262_cov_2.214604_4_plen_189_part_00